MRAVTRLLSCFTLLGIAFAGNAHAPQPAGPGVQAIDDAVRATIAHYRLPGIAVGVIDDGKVVYARGHGETVAGSGDPVTARTLFKIASNSKAMTAAVLARLAQQGRLRWDDPVVKHLPQFAMSDPWVTANMTVSDLLVHNSGLPQGGGDLMLWPEPNLFTRDDILRGLRHLEPAYGFRSGYAYDNLLYVVAGQVAAAAGGASYEELVRRELFAPLGLDGCRVGQFTLADAGSVAQPHMQADGRNVPMRRDAASVPEIASAPAGGIRCTLDDMLAWAGNWLAPTASQKAWLGDAQRAEMWKARTPMPISAQRRRWDDAHYYAYAYGFRVADADGAWTVSHTGTLGGMYSMMMLLPDRRSGFVLMINGDGDRARSVLGAVLLKMFTAPEKSLGVAGYARELAMPPAAAASAGPPLPDIEARTPASAARMQAWLGTWRDPWFGDVRVCAAGDGVEWRSLKSPKMHGRIGVLDGRYVLRWDDVAVDENAWLAFSGEGDARRLHMAKLNPQGDFSSDYEHLDFTRVGDCTVDGKPAAPRLSPAKTMRDAGMLDIRLLVPGIDQDIKYFGSDNFVGAPVDGYQAPRCYLKREAAEALARVERSLRERQQRLRVYDCYRPARAVAHFMRWAADPADVRTKAAHYPGFDKPQLLGDYIAPVSGHSRGATLDLTLLQCDASGSACAPLDMGTDFDFFGTRANTDSPEATDAQRANRQQLRVAMAAQGFRNYPMEWWHYSYQPEPTPGLLYDVPVQ